MSADISFLYKPSRWGEVFHALDVDEVLGAGAAGPGKSMVLLMDPVPRILHEQERQRPDYRGPHPVAPGQSMGWCLHLRRTRPMLDQTIARAKRIFNIIEPGVHWDSESTTFTFSCGYRYQFGHCKDPDSWIRYLSNEYDWIGFDELVQFDEEQYDQIITRLRSSDPVLRTMLKVRSCSNPLMGKSSADSFSVKDPQWVRRRFVEPVGEVTAGPPSAPESERRLWWNVPILERVIGKDEDGKDITRTWMYLPASLDDNPDKEFVKAYRQTLLAAPPHIKQAQLYGNWYVTVGSFYGAEWSARMHVCDPFRVPTDWKVFRSMDWGYKKPGVVHWWAMDRDETLYCIKELKFQGKLDHEVAEMIKDVERGMKLDLVDGDRSRITGPADTQLWEERGDSGKTKALVMAEHGVTWVKADKSSRQRNAEHLMGRLRDHEKGQYRPGIVFFRTCGHIVRWIPSVQTDPKNSECPEDTPNDHEGDSCFYGVGYAARGWKGLPERTAKRNPWGDDGPPPAASSGNRMSYYG